MVVIMYFFVVSYSDREQISGPWFIIFQQMFHNDLQKQNFIILTISAFFIGGGMAFFHGYEYLEKQKIDEPPFYKSYSKLIVVSILGWHSC